MGTLLKKRCRVNLVLFVPAIVLAVVFLLGTTILAFQFKERVNLFLDGHLILAFLTGIGFAIVNCLLWKKMVGGLRFFLSSILPAILPFIVLLAWKLSGSSLLAALFLSVLAFEIPVITIPLFIDAGENVRRE